jgi:hypothetical protein
VIFDTNGNIFGGFTPLKWTSDMPWVSSSVLPNLRQAAPMKSALKADQKGSTIYCCSGYGPPFGNGHGLYVANDCHLNALSYGVRQ